MQSILIEDVAFAIHSMIASLKSVNCKFYIFVLEFDEVIQKTKVALKYELSFLIRDDWWEGGVYVVLYIQFVFLFICLDMGSCYFWLDSYAIPLFLRFLCSSSDGLSENVFQKGGRVDHTHKTVPPFHYLGLLSMPPV